jgi:hypothetical protein
MEHTLLVHLIFKFLHRSFFNVSKPAADSFPAKDGHAPLDARTVLLQRYIAKLAVKYSKSRRFFITLPVDTHLLRYLQVTDFSMAQSQHQVNEKHEQAKGAVEAFN